MVLCKTHAVQPSVPLKCYQAAVHDIFLKLQDLTKTKRQTPGLLPQVQ